LTLRSKISGTIVGDIESKMELPIPSKILLRSTWFTPIIRPDSSSTPKIISPPAPLAKATQV